MGNANLNPWTEAKVDTKNPDRGPLLIIDGEKDHTVPWAIANAEYKKQKRNSAAVTEIVKIPNRGHALTIDHGWREVAPTRTPLRQAIRLNVELLTDVAAKALAHQVHGLHRRLARVMSADMRRHRASTTRTRGAPGTPTRGATGARASKQ